MLVPKLRFNEFKDEWKKIKLNKIATINPQNEILPNKFIYIDLESVEKGVLIYKNIINKENAPSRAQRTVKLNDILFQTVRPYQQNNYFINNIDNIPYVASTGYALLRTNEDSYFLYTLMYKEEFLNNVLNMCTGTSFPAINSNDLGTIEINLPAKNEQEKIGKLLKLLDKKIELQKQKIEALKIYKIGLIKELFSFNTFYEKNLEDLCHITTGKLDANAMTINGKYRFYTCAKEYYHINTYAFDTEALLISGNGAYVGYIHYYKGKFNAYQRTYVLDNFNENIFYIKYYLDTFLPQRILTERKEGNTPYIVLSTLAKMPIIFPSIEIQNQIITTLSKFDIKLTLENKKLDNLNIMKKSLLQQMFI